ncbi:MAG: ABC transporter ATP-binding protein [Acholeplasmatales bacterium]|nr:MAG: ABC transporter ATP-binding protein [Acholeplasmatales bacterium]
MKTNVAGSPPKTLLSLKDISMYFTGLKAVDALSFDIHEGEIVGLIGPNGAGKTTVFNCITQFYKSYEGNILFTSRAGETVDLRDIPVTGVIDQGIARTFQNVELVPDLSVLDNVLVGAHSQFKTGLIHHILRFPALKEEKRLKEKAIRLLDFLNLLPIKDFYAGGQPYGVRKKIEIARALMSEPRLIILDEPAAGLNDSETDELETIVHRIRDVFKATVLLIEHDMGFVMNICDRVCAINFGRFLAMDTPENIQKHPDVQEAYLGKDD